MFYQYILRSCILLYVRNSVHTLVDTLDPLALVDILAGESGQLCMDTHRRLKLLSYAEDW